MVLSPSNPKPCHVMDGGSITTDHDVTCNGASIARPQCTVPLFTNDN